MIFSFSAIDELAQHNLFRTIVNAVHTPNPLYLINSLKRLGHALPTFHLSDDELYALFAGMVCLSEVLIELAGQGQL